MALEPTVIRSWNYSKQDREGYSEQLIGTVVSIQEVQACEWTENGPGDARFWKNGNPVMNIRMGFATQDGQLLTFTFPEAGKEQKARRKPSVHMQMWDVTGNKSMNDLVGKTLQITTWPANPTTGQVWQRGNPRLFDIQEIQAGPFQLNSPLPSELTVPELLANNGAAGGQTVAPQQIQQPQVPMYQQYAQPQMQNGMYSAPTVPQVPMQPPVITAQTGVPAPVPTQAAPMPVGMDPSVAAAMQAMGAVNVQPISSIPYDEDIPF